MEKKKFARERGREEREEGGEKETCSQLFAFSSPARRQELTRLSFRLLIASILQSPNVKLAVTQFVTQAGYH